MDGLTNGNGDRFHGKKRVLVIGAGGETYLDHRHFPSIR